MNFLASSSNNPVALLEIVDSTNKMASGGNTNAKYIAGLIKPIISRIEKTKDLLHTILKIRIIYSQFSF